MTTTMLPEITYLTPPEKVSMGDAWFSIASTEHFWIRRRFEVLRKLAPDFQWDKLRLAEIGCGSGLLQRQIEDQFGASVDGFDLNEAAMKQSVARKSKRFSYNIYTRSPHLREAYDGLFLFDVIEHLDDHAGFLKAAIFHLKPGGHVFINVPSDPALFSAYDEAAGHIRRYLGADLSALAQSCGLRVVDWTYWGWPLRLLLHIRQRRLRGATDHDQILRDGFSSRGALLNGALHLYSQLEVLPQQRAGSSLMLIAQRPA